MIKTILEHINAQIEELNIFNKFFTLTERITIEDKAYPSVFEGEFKGIDFDFSENIIYHRLNGEPSFSEVESIVGGGTDIQYSIPLKTVAYIKQDSQYNLYDVAESIALLIMKSNSKTLKGLIGAYSVAISTRNIKTLSRDVFDEEFKGIDYHDSFISVDFDIVILANKNCLLSLECDVLNTCYVKVLDENGNVLLSGTCGNNYTIDISGTQITILFGTLPTSGTDIQDKNGNSIGTWVSESEILIPQLSTKDIDEFEISVDEMSLRWKNADDALNDMDDSLTTGGTIILFSGKDLFQRGSQLKIIIY